MDPAKCEKRKLSNIQRLESLKQQRREKITRTNQVTASLQNLDSSVRLNKKIIFPSVADEVNVQGKAQSKQSHDPTKPTLFDSSESEGEEEKDNHRFQIKPQFEGERGQRLLEMSSAITDDRFKLDERFKESEDEASDTNKGEEEDYSFQIEKEKNYEILEQVLGFQVSKKPPVGESGIAKKKKYKRFDPESADASSYLRKDPEEKEKEKPQSKQMKSKESSPPKEPVVSTVKRYFVHSDLKELMGKSGEQFSFTKKFDSYIKTDSKINDLEQTFSTEIEKMPLNSSDQEATAFDGMEEEEKTKDVLEQQSEFISIERKEQQKKDTFFFVLDDYRLKEGIEFFHRTKPIDEIREHWMSIRETVVEMYKKKKRAFERSPYPRAKRFKKQAFSRRHQ